MNEPQLHPGEQILFQSNPRAWTDPIANVLTLGAYRHQMRRTWFTVTTQRVIRTRTRNERSAPVSAIQDVRVEVKTGAGIITVKAAGRWKRFKFQPLPVGEAKAMETAIWQAMGRGASIPAQPAMARQPGQPNGQGT